MLDTAIFLLREDMLSIFPNISHKFPVISVLFILENKNISSNEIASKNYLYCPAERQRNESTKMSMWSANYLNIYMGI